MVTQGDLLGRRVGHLMLPEFFLAPAALKLEDDHGFVVDKYRSSFDGQSSVTITYYNGIGDPSQPANCSAVVFDEQRSNKRPEVALTEWVNFRVEGVK